MVFGGVVMRHLSKLEMSASEFLHGGFRKGCLGNFLVGVVELVHGFHGFALASEINSESGFGFDPVEVGFFGCIGCTAGSVHGEYVVAEADCVSRL